MSIALTNNTIDKFFGYLTKLDNASKKKLIIKLTESIEVNDHNDFDISKLYGAWVDSRSSDAIIKDIRDSRVEKNITTDF
jgi:hypothetical protein